jgi:hypothetical protein
VIPRVRHCIECPRCLTRYLLGFSPYRNGSYLTPLKAGLSDAWMLYCACARPPHGSRWSWNELKMYIIPREAHRRGYGPPEEICRFSECRGSGVVSSRDSADTRALSARMGTNGEPV